MKTFLTPTPCRLFFWVLLLVLGIANAQEKQRSILQNQKTNICEPIFPAKNLNMTWVKSVNVWYLTAWDRGLFDYFLEYLEGPETFAKLTETEKSQSCMTLTSFANQTDTFATSGGKYQINLAPIFNPIRPGVIDWQLNAKDYVATSYILISDNKSYFLGLDIFPDGVRGVWVASVEKTIPQSTIDPVIEKMQELGFPKESFFMPDFSKC